MKKPTRPALLSSLLILVIAVAIGAAATASSPRTASAQDDGGPYPNWRVENVRAAATANQMTITWEPPRVAKSYTVGTGDDATTFPRSNGVSKYVLWFEDDQPRDVPVTTQGVDVSTTVTGLEPGRRYNFNIQVCFDGTGYLSGCYVPEGHRTAFTAPDKPAVLNVSPAYENGRIRRDALKLSWVGSNALDVAPLDRYDRFECQYWEVLPNGDPGLLEACGLPNDRAKTVTVSGIIDDNDTYRIQGSPQGRELHRNEFLRHFRRTTRSTAATKPAQWRTVTVGGRPAAPTNVRITATTPDSVTLAWDAVTQTTGGDTVVGEVSYLVELHLRIFRGECPNDPSRDVFQRRIGMGRVTTGTTATVRNLDPDKTYNFSVLARDERRTGQSTGWVVTSPAPRTTNLPHRARSLRSRLVPRRRPRSR